VKYGRLTLNELILGLPDGCGRPKGVALLASGAPVKATSETKDGAVHIKLDEPVSLDERQKIEAVVEW
jgi:hypothetical protein